MYIEALEGSGFASQSTGNTSDKDHARRLNGVFEWCLLYIYPWLRAMLKFRVLLIELLDLRQSLFSLSVSLSLGLPLKPSNPYCVKSSSAVGQSGSRAAGQPG